MHTMSSVHSTACLHIYKTVDNPSRADKGFSVTLSWQAACNSLQCFGNISPTKAIHVQLPQQLLAVTVAKSQKCAHRCPSLHTSYLQT